MRNVRSSSLLFVIVAACITLARQANAQDSVSADSLGYRVSVGPSLQLDRLTLTIIVPSELFVLPPSDHGFVPARPGQVRGVRLVLTSELAARLREADSLATQFQYAVVIASSAYDWIQDGRFNAMYMNGRTDVRLGYLFFGPGGRPVTLSGLLPAVDLSAALAEYEKEYSVRRLSGS